MAGNTFGQKFSVTTFGESHGPALGVVIDGVPSKLEISEKDIQKELDKRRPGQSKVTTKRKEEDKVEILSGIFEGKTTGAPVALLIRNTNARSSDYEALKNVFRPGHADFTYTAKFGIRDWRGGGRSSGRETAARVAAGAIAKKILLQKCIKINAYTLSIGNLEAKKIEFAEIEKNIVRCPDKKIAKNMIEAIENVAKKGDSLGGIVEAVITGCPAGVGEPVFDKLEAKLGQALLSIGAVKGIEFGDGFKVAQMQGSECYDEFIVKNNKIHTKTNHAGGILGGISTGENIVLRVAVKPTPSIAIAQETVNNKFRKKIITIKGRHDPCLCPRIVPVVEAMIALTLVDFLI